MTVEGTCPVCRTEVRVVSMTAAGARYECDCGAVSWTVGGTLEPPRPELKLVPPPDDGPDHRGDDLCRFDWRGQ